MFCSKRIYSDSNDLEKIVKLYEYSFPENERKPYKFLLHETNFNSDLLAFYDDDEFCGFASLLTHGDITHILFFAMDETKRNKGYGSKALEKIVEFVPGNRILADIEMVREDAKNNIQRLARKEFYMDHGYYESGITYMWQNEKYEILVHGKSITEEEFNNFWNQFEEN